MTKKFWANLALCVFLGFLAILSVTKISSALTSKGLFVTEPQPSPEVVSLMDQVVLVKYLVGESQGHVIAADFVIQNDSDRDVKNLCVLCEFYTDNGEYMDRKWWTLNRTVPAGQTVTVSSIMRRFINSKSQALNCRIADFQLVKEPFFVLNTVVAGGYAATSSADSDHGASGPAPTGH